MNKIGYADFDFEGFCSWNDNFIPENKKMANPSWVGDHWQNYFYERQELFRDCLNVMDSHDFKRSSIDDLKALLTHLKDIGEKLQLFYFDDTACVIGYENRQYLMNPVFVKPEYLKDYSELIGSEMKSLTGQISGAGLLPSVIEESSVKTLSAKKSEAEKAMEDARAEIKAKEDEIRQEMYKRIEEMKALMQGKLDELNEKVEQYQKEIFILESQIYSIRCYTGEVIKFHQIRKGKPAPKEEALILYQKIRFLDEELGKHISIFDFDGEDDIRLIPLLKARDDIAEFLAPGKRSLTILRTSRTGKFIGANEEVDNILTEYEMYHGKQLALLLRDGENLYIAWCDADNIVINEENAFYSTAKQTEERAEGADSVINSAETNIHEALSRYYLLAILQGMIDAKNILDFPEPVNVLDPTQRYVIFSLAEGWIIENKYGTFAEMLEKVRHIPIKKGDDIITILGLSPDRHGKYQKYCNDRGIGYKNRTSGAFLRGKTIYPVNLVLNDVVVEYDFEAIEVTESLGEREMCCTRNGVTTKEIEPCIKYTVGEKILFTGTKRTRFDFEAYKDMKAQHKDLLECVINSEDAIGSIYNSVPTLYYKGKDGRERRYHRRDYFSHGDDMTVTEQQLYCKRITGCRIIEEVPHTFVSVEQKGYGSYSNDFKDTTYHVNLEVYEDEYFPLTFFCSSWIEEVMQNGNIGNLSFPGATPSFADMLPYLHKMFEYLKEREEIEKGMLIEAGGKAFVEANSDWNAILCEWKIENNVHTLSLSKAKSFVKSVKGEVI